MPTGSALSLVFSRALGQVIVHLHGVLDDVTAHQLDDQLLQVIDGQGNRQLVLDLGGLSRIEGAGFSVLIDALRRVRRLGGELVLSAATVEVIRAFQAAGLDKLFYMAPAWMHPAAGDVGSNGDWKPNDAQ